MSMDTPQLGLLFGATVAQHQAERPPVGAPGGTDGPAAPDARTPDPPHARRSPPPPGRRGRPRDPVRGRAPREMTFDPPGHAPATTLSPHGVAATGRCRHVPGDTADDRDPRRCEPDDGVQRVLLPTSSRRCAARSWPQRPTSTTSAPTVGTRAGPRHHRRGRRPAHRVDRHRVPRPHRGSVLRRGRGRAGTHRHGGRAAAVDQLRGLPRATSHGRRPRLRLRQRLPGRRLADQASAPLVFIDSTPLAGASSVLLDERTAPRSAHGTSWNWVDRRIGTSP